MSLKRGLQYLARSPTRKAVTPAALVAAGYPAAGAEDPETYARKLSAVDRCMSISGRLYGQAAQLRYGYQHPERLQHPILRLLNMRPNEAMTPSVRKEVLENSRNEGGNGYDWIVRSPQTGQVVELIPVPWYLVEPWRDTGGRIWYTVTHPFTGEPMVLPQEDICHYKGATRDGLKGISVLRRAADTLAEARAAQEYNKTFYENGGQPSGVLETASDLGGYYLDQGGKPLKRPDGSLITKKDHCGRNGRRFTRGPRTATGWPSWTLA